MKNTVQLPVVTPWRFSDRQHGLQTFLRLNLDSPLAVELLRKWTGRLAPTSRRRDAPRLRKEGDDLDRLVDLRQQTEDFAAGGDLIGAGTETGRWAIKETVRLDRFIAFYRAEQELLLRILEHAPRADTAHRRALRGVDADTNELWLLADLMRDFEDRLADVRIEYTYEKVGSLALRRPRIPLAVQAGSSSLVGELALAAHEHLLRMRVARCIECGQPFGYPLRRGRRPTVCDRDACQARQRQRWSAGRAKELPTRVNERKRKSRAGSRDRRG